MSSPLRALDFPPLLTGLAVAGDPMDAAREAAAQGIDPGTVFYGTRDDLFEAAVVLAPEVPLGEAMAVSFAVTLGLNDAMGALAPPEVGVHLVWPDRIKVNGGLCGRLRAAASTRDPAAEPDWLVLAIDMPLARFEASEPGHAPDQTCLWEEGCGEVAVPDLVEAWARHMMNWLHVYLTEGFEPLHREWRGKADGYGGEITYPETGTFLGLDAHGGMLLKSADGMRLLPLTRLLGT